MYFSKFILLLRMLFNVPHASGKPCLHGAKWTLLFLLYVVFAVVNSSLRNKLSCLSFYMSKVTNKRRYSEYALLVCTCMDSVMPESWLSYSDLFIFVVWIIDSYSLLPTSSKCFCLLLVIAHFSIYPFGFTITNFLNFFIPEFWFPNRHGFLWCLRWPWSLWSYGGKKSEGFSSSEIECALGSEHKQWWSSQRDQPK